MPRGKQAKMAESKKRTASTKSVSDEELSPKRAKALKDANKTGILDKCVFCTKSGVRTMLEGAGTATNMRFHLAAEHYFPEGKFKDVAPPSADDLEPGKLLPNDLMGKVYKYSCHFQPCTKRKQGYKELVLHLATQHQLLKEVMSKDKRPGVAAVFAALYEDEEQVKKVVDAVKQEKNATRGNVGKENLDENVDDPPPALPVKPARAAKKLPQVQVQPRVEVAAAEKAYTGPRIDKVHNCLLCEAKEGRNLSFGYGLMELRNHYSVRIVLSHFPRE